MFNLSSKYVPFNFSNEMLFDKRQSEKLTYYYLRLTVAFCYLPLKFYVCYFSAKAKPLWTKRLHEVHACNPYCRHKNIYIVFESRPRPLPQKSSNLFLRTVWIKLSKIHSKRPLSIKLEISLSLWDLLRYKTACFKVTISLANGNGNHYWETYVGQRTSLYSWGLWVLKLKAWGRIIVIFP